MSYSATARKARSAKQRRRRHQKPLPHGRHEDDATTRPYSQGGSVSKRSGNRGNRGSRPSVSGGSANNSQSQPEIQNQIYAQNQLLYVNKNPSQDNGTIQQKIHANKKMNMMKRINRQLNIANLTLSKMKK